MTRNIQIARKVAPPPLLDPWKVLAASVIGMGAMSGSAAGVLASRALPNNDNRSVLPAAVGGGVLGAAGFVGALTPRSRINPWIAAPIAGAIGGVAGASLTKKAQVVFEKIAISPEYAAKHLYSKARDIAHGLLMAKNKSTYNKILSKGKQRVDNFTAAVDSHYGEDFRKAMQTKAYAMERPRNVDTFRVVPKVPADLGDRDFEVVRRSAGPVEHAIQTRKFRGQ